MKFKVTGVSVIFLRPTCVIVHRYEDDALLEFLRLEF